ncbi:amidase family protein [Nocardia sp. NPDC059228]|uniref:amidase family protein n=1 Tax=Nocardia sp. NPDC059228 TaxID=3346777 RepID=UPI003680D4DB
MSSSLRPRPSRPSGGADRSRNHRRHSGFRSAWIGFNYPATLAGQPAASIPAGWTDSGLPVGLQIIGRHLDDATVIPLAAAIERVALWAHLRPPVAPVISASRPATTVPG